MGLNKSTLIKLTMIEWIVKIGEKKTPTLNVIKEYKDDEIIHENCKAIREIRNWYQGTNGKGRDEV